MNPGDEEAQPGALGLGKKKAYSIDKFLTFYIYCVPILGAWVADTYLGRFKTIVWAVIIAELGHAIVVGSAAPKLLDKPTASLAVFMIGLIVFGLGTGTFKPNISPLITEQIPQDAPRVEVDKKGEPSQTALYVQTEVD